MIAVTFAELDIVTRAITSQPTPPSLDFEVIDPREKMRRNGLTQQIEFLLTLGLGKAAEVKDFVQYVAYRDAEFPERLRTGFINEYHRLIQEGYYGDSLFEALRIFSCRASQDFALQAAGLAVLAYLFNICEVFEK